MFTKPITEEQALDKGIDMFIDIVFYSILIFLPLYELHVGQIEA
jgi:hypothetical protein